MTETKTLVETKTAETARYATMITDALAIMGDANDSPYVKGEFFGYFLNRLVAKFLGSPDYARESFNSPHFNEGKKKALMHAADSAAAMLSRADPIASAAELHYVVAAMVGGHVTGYQSGAPASYGVYAYYTGIIDKIYTNVLSINAGSQRDMTMNFRRHLLIRGVLRSVLDEMARCTTPADMPQFKKIWAAGGKLAEAVAK